MDKTIIEELLGNKFGKARENVMLNKYTTFNIGGPADILVEPETEEQISSLVKFCNEKEIPLTVIGKGSNLLIKDKGIRGVVIALRENFSDITVDGNIVTAQAGASLRNTSIKSFENNLTGMEAVSGIPGSVGGAIIMNAGAYGAEMKDIVKSVRCMHRDGEIVEYTNEEMDFSYRHSLASENEYVVISTSFELKEGNKEEIYAAFEDFDYKRSSRQPLDRHSAGSTFKRPEGHYASKLIDDAGLRGFTIDKAQVSEKHCGFLINIDDATCENMLTLIKEVQKRIKDDFGVTLETEVKIIGE
ncbi:UDP-N-acetylmuramate dehydrogenase [Helcococcus kunzii]|uniref:UDP-N-acetylmuramate dehydrogenase n=1 Tax=Helcococcus kunzii TaxID=40091 RepID=UPI0038A3B2A5